MDAGAEYDVGSTVNADVDAGVVLVVVVWYLSAYMYSSVSM